MDLFLLMFMVVNLEICVVSLVDGYNLPARISNNKGCPVADCPVDLGPNCEYFMILRIVCILTTFTQGPAALKGPYDSSGFPVGCKSACVRPVIFFLCIFLTVIHDSSPTWTETKPTLPTAALEATTPQRPARPLVFSSIPTSVRLLMLFWIIC